MVLISLWRFGVGKGREGAREGGSGMLLLEGERACSYMCHCGLRGASEEMDE